MNEVYNVLLKYSESLLLLYKLKVGEDTLISKDATSDVKVNSGEYEVVLNLNDYWRYIESGREAGTFPNVDAIKEWILIKPILPSPINLPDGRVIFPNEDLLTYLIGRSILQNGIEAKPYLLESINELLDLLINELKVALNKDVTDEIIKMFL